MTWLQARYLIWELWARNRLELALILIGIPLAMLVGNLIVYYLPEAVIAQALTRLLAVWGVIGLAMLLAYAEFSSKRLETGFPRHVLMLPVPSWLLAMAPLAFASLLLLAFVLLVIGIAGVWELAALDHLWLFVAAVASTAWMQAINWGLAKTPVRAAIVLFGVVGMGGIAMLSTLSFSPATLLPAPWGELTLILLAVSGAVLSWLSVRGERCGRTIGQVRFWSDWALPGFSLPGRFSSPAAALFWVEWRIFGWIFPMAMVFFGTVLYAALILPNDTRDSAEAVSMIIFMFVYTAALLGMEMSKSHLGASDHRMDKFTATRPVPSPLIAHAKLRAAALSIAVGAAICLVPLVAFAFSDRVAIAVGWAGLERVQGLVGAIGASAVGATIIPLLAWIFCANLLAVTLLGLKQTKRWIMFGVAAVVPVLGLMGYQITHNTAWMRIFMDYAEWLAAIPGFCLAIGVGWAWRRYARSWPIRPLILPSSIAGVWLILALFTTFELEAPVSRAVLAEALVAIALASVLPWLVAPLALRRNRHR